jgi:hypothetical protein
VAAVLVVRSLGLACRRKYEDLLLYEVPSPLLVVFHASKLLPFLNWYISPLLIFVSQSHHNWPTFPLVGEILPSTSTLPGETETQNFGGCQQYQDARSHARDHSSAYSSLAIGTLTIKAREAPSSRHPSILSPVGWCGALSMQPRSRLFPRYRSSNLRTTALGIWNSKPLKLRNISTRSPKPLSPERLLISEVLESCC